jgi:tRNA (adenine37-N6)-methyltransferase
LTDWEERNVEQVTFRVIGTVRSPVVEPTDEGWGAVESDVVLDPGLAGALAGMEGFSHVLVIYVLDRYQWNGEESLTRRPQGRPDMPEVGLFAQRAKHRPNPIAVTAAEIVAVGEDRVRVRGLDAVDGSPVLDLKPYYPQYDRRDATTPEWVARLMASYFG